MKRSALALVSTLVCSVVLSACGGTESDPYCETVTKAKPTLDSFGQERTNEAFDNYSKVLADIAAQAPETVKSDWNTLSEVTNGVIDAHEEVGLSLEDMTDTEKLADVDQDDLPKLNDAYQEFNDTTAQREAVVKNVKAECDITLQ